MTDDMVAFLRARLDEDERIANACPDKEWRRLGQGAGDEHMTRHDPARVLREVEAKRRIIAAYEDEDALTYEEVRGVNFALRCLAGVYADHPDYSAAWRPA